MALNFTYKKYKDIHTITNTAISTVNYTITRKECNSRTLIKSGAILPNEIFILPIHLVDGVYEVILTDTVLTAGVFQTQTLADILYYNNLLLIIINNIESALCGCKPCNDCKDCDDCETYLNTINQILAFSYVNNPVYNSYLNTIGSTLKCSYTELITCMITKNIILGNEDTKNIFFQIIAMHYLAFYLYDLSQAFDNQEAEYIKIKYKSAKILKCIKKLGIDTDDIMDSFITNINVFYWQINDLFQDITNIIPIFDNNYLIGKSQSIFEEFEQGKVVSYTSVGRIAFAIQKTDILNFVLTDSLGNDVTNEFDKQYFPVTQTVLYVSKIPYANSNIFFKFKKITFLP